MANTVAPKLSGVGSGFSVKTYNYGGSLKSSNATSVYSDYEQIDYSIDPDVVKAKNTNSAIDSDLVKKVLSTGAVVGASVVSGVLKVVEHGIDGIAWCASKIFPMWAEEYKQFIAEDLVGNAQKAIFENTELGRKINENSKWKYNGKEAQAIQKGSEAVTVFALATAATVATGGGAAAVATPMLAGFAVGSGKKSESLYKEKMDTTKWDELGILVAGVAEAANWYAKGKLGQGLINAAGAIKALGLKNTGAKLVGGVKSILQKSPKEMVSGLKNILKGTFNTSNLTRTVSKSVRDINNLTDSVGIIADNTARWIGGDEEFNVKNVLKAAGELGLAFAMNVTFDAFAEYLTKAKRLQDIPEMNEKQKANLEDIFNREHEVANGKAFDTMEAYREHAELHTDAVREYAIMLGLDVNGLDDKALAELYYAAYFHDLGMECGFVDVDGTKKGVIYDKKGNCLGFLEDLNIDDVPDGKTLSALYGETGRSNHPLNSAIEVLSDDLVPEGMDKDKIALLALSHSKSTSGVKSFADTDDWMKAIDKLDDAVKEYNIENNLVGKPNEVKFDADRMRELISDPNSKEFKELTDQALCLRDADAMSEVARENGRTKMQGGGVAHIDSPSYDYNQKITKEQEISEISDIVHTEKVEVDPKTGEKTIVTKTTEVKSDMGKQYHAGEENVEFDSQYNGKDYNGRVRLNDPHKVPYSSEMNIEERIMEGATFTNCETRDFEIELPKKMKGTEMGNLYESNLESFKNKKVSEAAAEYTEVYSKYKQGKASADELAAAGKKYQQLEEYYRDSIHIEYK